ncbi:MAG: site-specific tyrosine recombinase XerD [Puniceicoccales bacterium]|nr:site-specific tyrosine recombinase XerD [Puniceicoccales bacterium]
MEEEIDDFIAVLLTEHGLSKNTALAYEKDISQFAAFATQRGRGGWQDVQREDVAAWTTALSDAPPLRHSSEVPATAAKAPAIRQPVNARTLARKLSALRTFAKHLVATGVRRDDFTALAEGPRTRRPLPDTLSEAEVGRLLEAPPLNTPHGLRDRAMLELMYGSGLRVSELCGLTLQSVDLEEGFLRVLGKGAKERVVPVGRKSIEALRNYLSSPGRPFFVRKGTGSALFLSERGVALSRKTFWVHLKGWARDAGITRPVKPHLLRHSFATHLLAHGAGLREIQEMLGHADISTTEIYTAVERKRLVELHAKHHPRRAMRVG